MSLPVKILVVIAGLVVTVVVALIFLVKTQVTPEKIRETLVPLVEKHLHRQIEFDDVAVGLFSGVVVKDLTVHQIDQDEPFIFVKSLRLNYRLWALFRGQLLIDQIALEQPTIRIIRLTDSGYNFSDLIKYSRAVSEDGEKPSGTTRKSAEKKPPLDLLMGEINISNGEIFFTDRYLNKRSPYRYQVEKLNLRARNITFDKAFPIDFSAVINGSQIDMSGHYHLAKKTGDLVVNVESMDMIPFSPYYRSLLPFNVGSAHLRTNLEVDLQPDKILSKGRVALEQLDLVSHEDPDFNLKNAGLGAEYALSYGFSEQKLAFSTLLLNFNDLKAGLEGELALGDRNQNLVATLQLDQLDLRQVMLNVPETLVRDYLKYSLAGSVSGSVKLSGPLSSGVQLIESARLVLADVQMSKNQLRAGIDGELTYRDKELSSEALTLEYGGMEARLKLKATNLFGKTVQGQFELKAKELDLNSLQSTTAQNRDPGNVTDREEGASLQQLQVSDVGPFRIPADISGRVTIERLLYKQLLMNQLSADVVLRDNRLSISDLSTRLNGGQFTMASVIDLGVKGLAYQGQLSLAQPDAAGLVSGLFPTSPQTLNGQLQWQGGFSGRGTQKEQLLQALQLKGEFSLLQGVVKGVPVLEQVAAFLGDPQFKVLSFRNLSGSYQLSDGLARIDALLDSSKMRLKPKGTIAVNGRLNLKLDARLAPEASDRIGTGQVLKKLLLDQQGWTLLPLEIKGTLQRPVVTFDSAALQRHAVEKTKEQATTELLEKIAPNTQEQEPIRQLLDNTLNKLFGN
ncbi:MAG: DUF748 domain-containing protein [Desulfuromonadales bacterium]|nr:DUF748 domain-containing protein [Desulfuromonadales bacterium]